ncbi:ribosome biogenesis GTPase Der [Nocardioides sp. GCM10027113]|uniref:ribosome biogenesis GTPase Der n=1 Tax=unclassified Nocardioides TaxID=2615069 RepID=UPI003609E469
MNDGHPEPLTGPDDYDAVDDENEHLSGPVPVLAVVGRPNVGKSTLVNRIIGRREAVVEDVPGVTRDRVSYDATWNGRAFTVVDTGGWDPDARGLAERIAAQAEIAVGLADAVLFVVDATVGITDADEAVVKILRRSKKPVVLAANKVDDMRTEAEAYGLWNLGLGEPFPVSALHGRGSGDMLDAVLAALPEPPPERLGEVGGPRRVAIVGKPNVGKSSLLNKLAGEDRVVVDNVAGTTVDPVDELVELGGRTWRFIDTAGIRKRVKEASGHEYYASLRTSTAIDRAEVAVLVVDADLSISEQDIRILQTIREAGRALVIAFNKWDLVDEERRYYLEREVERELVQVQWAPRINITARTGWHVDRLVPALDKALEGWETRVPTGALNSFLGRLVAEHPHPVRGGKQPKILFGTQPSTSPPTFVLFTSGKLEASYLRFVERRLREEFGFVGTPIVIQQRPREKRKR